MAMLYYLAYGSNLHPYRLTQRVRSAQLIGMVHVTGKRLVFHKRSRDGSGKCMFYDTADHTDILHCALYQFNSHEKAQLNRLEGSGNGYGEAQFKVTIGDAMYVASMYIAQSTHIDSSRAPYSWYKDMVLLGAEYHHLPSSYLTFISAVPATIDTDIERARDRALVVEEMRRINNASAASTANP